MSGPYRLQTPRPRPPPPLRFDQSSPKLSSVHDVQIGSPTLLYPSPTSATPPTSPRTKARLISPTSSSFTARSRPGAQTPPPAPRNRSTTPSGVDPNQLEAFAAHCRSWYFNQDEESGRLMTQTLTTLPSSQRAPFSRLQASIRSAYHRSVNARRNAEFQAHLAATQPGGSLMPHSRADPRGVLARKERYGRMERFVRNWCTMGMPGTIPFFEALWAVFRLQVIPQNLGGAGVHRIEWEFDDAVFKEAAGKDFMMEAIDVLKGVLAFEETASKDPVRESRDSSGGASMSHSRTRSQPVPSDQKFSSGAVYQPRRVRAPSDPFLDTPTLTRSVASKTLPTPEEYPLEDSLAGFEEADEFLRIWLSPELPNPEIQELLKLFPAFVTRRPLPRFPVLTPRHADIEEGEGGEGKRLCFGTGSMWISPKERSDGWNGSWWSRLVLWWKRLFC